jgi:hypothetical protein
MYGYGEVTSTGHRNLYLVIPISHIILVNEDISYAVSNWKLSSLYTNIHNILVSKRY